LTFLICDNQLKDILIVSDLYFPDQVFIPRAPQKSLSSISRNPRKF